MNEINFIRSKIPDEELLCLIAEEAAELAQAALKCHRAITGINPTPTTPGTAWLGLLEEIADVQLCQTALCLSAESMRVIEQITAFKTKRWVERLEGSDRNAEEPREGNS